MDIIVICIISLALLLGFISTTGFKSQWIRLVDIFVIGPIMIYLGNQGYTLTNNKLYLALIFFGATTITYNLKNYIQQQK
jgi:hypothetical protein